MTSFAVEPTYSQGFGAALRVDRSDNLMSAIIDNLPEDATQAQIDGMTAQWVMGELRTPKTLQTVRRRFVQLWPLIAPLAERQPDQFDAITLEFAERTTCLD
jgi:hypothetical protein